MRCDAETSYVVTVVASQLLSPVLWDHYAMLLLLPTALLLQRRQWWAVAIPLAGWLPAPIYPVLFFVALLAPIVGAARDGRPIGRRVARLRRAGRLSQAPAGARATPCCRFGARLSACRPSRCYLLRRAIRHPDVRARAADAGPVRTLAASRRLVGTAVVVVSFVVYLLCNRQFNAGPRRLLLPRRRVPPRPDVARCAGLGPYDNVVIDGRVYVPFAPFPGDPRSCRWSRSSGRSTPTPGSRSSTPALAALDVGLVWVLAARIGVRSIGDRFWLALLFGFSTAIWWVTTRGGVWHTGHLVASMLTLLILIELFGRAACARRPARRRRRS